MKAVTVSESRQSADQLVTCWACHQRDLAGYEWRCLEKTMDTEQTKQQKHDSGSSLMTDIFVLIVNKSTKRPKLNSEHVSACTHTESLQAATVETLPADRGSKSGWVGRTGRRSPRLWTGIRPGSPPSPWGHNMRSPVSSDIKKTASQTLTAAPRRHSVPNSI